MARQRKSSESYSGPLAEPLKPRFRRLRRTRRPRVRRGVNASTLPPPLPIFEVKPSRTPQWRAEYDQKLPLLLEHFGIKKADLNPWYNLALCLAVAHVPGFQEKSGRTAGRKRTVSREDEAKLYVRFCELKNKGHSERSAAAIMAKELKKPGTPGASGAALLRRMQRHDAQVKKFAALFESIKSPFPATQNPVP